MHWAHKYERYNEKNKKKRKKRNAKNGDNWAEGVFRYGKQSKAEKKQGRQAEQKQTLQDKPKRNSNKNEKDKRHAKTNKRNEFRSRSDAGGSKERGKAAGNSSKHHFQDSNERSDGTLNKKFRGGGEEHFISRKKNRGGRWRLRQQLKNYCGKLNRNYKTKK